MVTGAGVDGVGGFATGVETVVVIVAVVVVTAAAATAAAEQEEEADADRRSPSPLSHTGCIVEFACRSAACL